MMGRKNINAKEFNEDLSFNEESMGDGAAMQVTCEQHGIDLEAGFELLIELAEQEDD